MAFNSHIVARFGRLSIDVDRVRAGHGLAEEALVRHDKRVDAWYADNLKRDPGDAEFLAYLHQEQKDDAANGYPQILRSALFATGYGVFELFLAGLCKEIGKHARGPELSELRGDGIQRARLYLEKVARVDFPDTAEWQRLLLYGRLRNVVVHAQGELAQNSNLPAVKSLLATEKTFALSDGEATVVLAKGFNPRFLDLVDTFALQLNLKLDAYINAA